VSDPEDNPQGQGKGSQEEKGETPNIPQEVPESTGKGEVKQEKTGGRKRTKPDPQEALKKRLDALDAIDRAMLAFISEHPAATNEEIGAQVGMGRTAIIKRRQSPAFKRALTELMMPVMKVLQRYGGDAARLLGRQLRSDDGRLAQGAGVALLKYIVGESLNIGTKDQDHGMSDKEAILLGEAFRKSLEKSEDRKTTKDKKPPKPSE